MVNKRHPDYEKYVEECDKVRDTYAEKVLNVKKTKNLCKDGPIVKIHKEFAKEIKKIQEKYSYLFIN